MASPLVPDDFEVPLNYEGPGFRLEPLGPEHNERDHAAWMGSLEHIRSTPGFPDGSWPSPMSLERNLEDLVRHANDFEIRKGFTYSVLDDEEVIGCVYIYPKKDADGVAEVSSWVVEGRADLDRVVYDHLTEWLADWPIEIEYEPRP